jgi:hypothetical protein
VNIPVSSIICIKLTYSVSALETYSKTGIKFPCTDRYDRQCFLIIIAIVADYEEQAIITGVKYNQQYTICHVLSNERAKLIRTWRKRTHGIIKTQLNDQTRNKTSKTNNKWLHPIENFAWAHSTVNIYQAIMVDILYQLLKGLVMNAKDWIKKFLKTSGGQNKKWNTESLNKRFKNIPPFGKLRIFSNYLNVSQ